MSEDEDAIAGINLPDYVEDYLSQYGALCARDADKGGGWRARGEAADALRNAIRRAIYDAEQAATLAAAAPSTRWSGEEREFFEAACRFREATVVLGAFNEHSDPALVLAASNQHARASAKFRDTWVAMMAAKPPPASGTAGG